MNIGDICNRDPATVCASATLSEAARLLSDSYADAIVAIASPVQRPTAVGIITYEDLMNTLAFGSGLKQVRVLDVLDRNPLLLHEEDDIEAAVLKLRSRGAKHAPVVGSGGMLLGEISMDRLLGCRSMEHLRPPAAIADNAYK